MSARDEPTEGHVEGVDLAGVAERARRLLAAVECGDLVADDSVGELMVEAWRYLATVAAPRHG